MSEENVVQETSETSEVAPVAEVVADESGKVEKPSFKAIESQDALDKIIQDRVAREKKKYSDFDKYKDAYDKLSAVEAQKETEAREKLSFEERLTAERADWEKQKSTLESELEGLRLSQLRAEVAAAKNVPAALIGRLQGATKDELEADADALLAAVVPKASQTHRPEPVGGGAPKTSASAAVDGDMLDRVYNSIYR